MSDFTDDKFLGGRLIIRQPASGFRAGLDAVMLAAAVPARAGDTLLELGAGVGTASLCTALREPDCSILGLEIDVALAAFAQHNAQVNNAGRVQFLQGDVFDPPAHARKDFDHVFCNPPFHGPDGALPPDAGRARALHDGGALGDWLATGLKRTVSGGTFTAIIRADRLGEALRALPDTGIAVFPLWPKEGEAAKRVIVQVRKGSREALRLLPGLVLHAEGGKNTPQCEAILREGAALDLD
ncbi:MAG TPA: methyltransferase [Rhizomicrobium sp.]|nr:methyltransferase [Rhizomicrobium sp.]